MRRAGEIVAIAFALVLLAAIAMYSNRPAEQQSSVPSMSDSGSRGVAAWALLLQREGLQARAFTAHLTQLEARDATVILAGGPGDLDSPPSSGEMHALAKWIEGGGHVVLVGFVLDRTASRELHVSQLVVLSRKTPDAIVTPGLSFAYPVKRLRGEFNAYYKAAAHEHVLARTRFGILAERHAVGKGDVLAIADPEIFDNATLAKPDNARFGVAILRTKTVLFDEAIYGASNDRRFWDVLGVPMQTAVIISCILALLAVGGNILPFAPPLRAPQAASRTSSGYIESLAQLLAAGRARTHAIATFAESARQRIRGRSVTDGIRARMNELSDLANRLHPADADVVRASRLYAAIRKDVK